jgi:hypothetical protein
MGSGSGGHRGCRRFAEPPFPRQELVRTVLGDRGDAREAVAQLGLGIDLVELGRHDERKYDSDP